ncbi:hydrogenase maturation protein HypF [Kribbella voronezhensis]|uniref:Carbamoyltransferase n=1 Tax=Kribbella voronezhensis TaxID=2512212 RepID=A0A4R7TBE0_9ACTN|nr:carbamoyltransferase HypF [Kribbella voronezhensis]TDU88587.1 hydrogenase maturation protein HypF [Kribbella voronezhensis]
MGVTTDQVSRIRARITVSGAVQGVGFRPFVYALARELGLSGQVANTSSGVVVEVEGAGPAVASFTARLDADAPPLAVVDRVLSTALPVIGGTAFVIRDSATGPGRTLVSPDVATCNDCLAEFADPGDRRYRHPFITCTNCGPRFTIITGLPYDRPATTMASFDLCPECAHEYADPADRRFHAQPIACPNCGPRLELTAPGEEPRYDEDALAGAHELLEAGSILAVKGLGGFHLACDASDPAAVETLRKRKDRGDKPFAVMAADLDTARRLAYLDEDEVRLLTDHRRPIVLARRRPGTCLAEQVAPGNPDVGIMLPYTPLHRLLFDQPGACVLVLTSGNLSGEPIVTSDEEARDRLAPLADAWLGHDRPIHVPCDDSVVRMVDGIELPIRRSRGYAPFPIALPLPVRPALAVGGDLKNTFCLGDDRYAWLSAHVGDMDDLSTLRAFERAEQHLEELTGVRPEVLVTDKHPSYRSRQWAESHAEGRPVVGVQHHHAHIASVLAEHAYDGGRVIGFAFDGTGYGDDGAVWGGEVLLADYEGFERYTHLSYVQLPGGDAGVLNPCRMALSHLVAAGLPWDARLPAVKACTEQELLRVQLERDVACAPTSSMGRLFDAVSSLAGVCHRVGYEAQAAIELEGLAVDHPGEHGYEFAVGAGMIDPEPVLAAVVRDVLDGVAAGVIGARFHQAVADVMVTTAEQVRAASGPDTVALSGGVFANRLLLSASTRALSAAGFEVLRPRRVPPTDAGLALGQLAVAARVPARKEQTACV